MTTTQLSTICVRSALIEYLRTLDTMHSQTDSTLALALARVANRRLLESLEAGEAKTMTETTIETGERILDIAREIREADTKCERCTTTKGRN